LVSPPQIGFPLHASAFESSPISAYTRPERSPLVTDLIAWANARLDAELPRDATYDERFAAGVRDDLAIGAAINQPSPLLLAVADLLDVEIEIARDCGHVIAALEECDGEDDDAEGLPIPPYPRGCPPDQPFIGHEYAGASVLIGSKAGRHNAPGLHPGAFILLSMTL
jgi:hypothetical protein